VGAPAGPVVFAQHLGLLAASPRIGKVAIRDFRSYERAELQPGDGLTVIVGPNGAGKTNLLEAIYCGCTGRSCRAANERDMVRFGATATRVAVSVVTADGHHDLTVAFAPGEAKRLQIDGAPVDSLMEAGVRPLLTVFLPERLEVVKGPPAVRRAHLDQLVAALWPARVATRRSYAQTLGQRNALISRIRIYGVGREALAPWDQQLARHGIALMEDRKTAVGAMSEGFSRAAAELGLAGGVSVRYRPGSRAASPEELAAELSERIESDLERGFTGHGPHRDELMLLRDNRELRSYGSQGEQRLALLALLLSEREAIARLRGALSVALLDDVMSELDRGRREALVTRLRADGGQAVITASESEHVPGAHSPDVTTVSVSATGTVTAYDSHEA
jgi:DNA replication and repair protein RecF